MSPAEENAVKTSARNGWLLSAPALVMLALAAAGPLLIVIWYSFLTANDTGGIIRTFSVEGWKGITKKLGLAAIGVAAVGSLLHGLLGRANKVTPEDDHEAEELVEHNLPGGK